MEIYHVLNRGVDKRKIFIDEQDYFRGIHDLYEFNNQDSVESTFHIFNKCNNPDVRRRDIKNKKPRKLLVNILAFCLMPNHYHFLITPKIENGVALFMKKFNGGYTKYFNIKHERNGALFEGKYKRIIIKNESHFVHLPYYIHCNPLDLIAPEWRQRELGNYKKAMKFLENYRWSSHLDYLGKKNFPSVTQRDFLLDFFNGHNGYKNNIEGWLKDLDIEEINEFTLD